MTSLPTGYVIRRPTDDDVPALLTLVHAHDTAVMGAPDFSADDVREVLQAPHHDPAHDSWIVTDPAGAFAAWAYIDNPYGYPAGVLPRERLDVIVHPDAGALHGPLLGVAVERVVQRIRAAGVDRAEAYTAHVLGQEHLREAILAAGFTFTRRYARMHRNLTGDERPPPPPPATLVREVDPDRDARTMYRIIDTAFSDLPDYTSVGFEAWWPSVDVAATAWDECLFAEVDGVPAAVLQSAAHAAADHGGWVRNLAVLPAHRGRGLARLLLSTVFARYAAKGHTWAGLGVDTSNPTGAFPLYESVGMHPAYQSDVYNRILQA